MNFIAQMSILDDFQVFDFLSPQLYKLPAPRKPNTQ